MLVEVLNSIDVSFSLSVDSYSSMLTTGTQQRHTAWALLLVGFRLSTFFFVCCFKCLFVVCCFTFKTSTVSGKHTEKLKPSQFWNWLKQENVVSQCTEGHRETVKLASSSLGNEYAQCDVLPQQNCSTNQTNQGKWRHKYIGNYAYKHTNQHANNLCTNVHAQTDAHIKFS